MVKVGETFNHRDQSKKLNVDEVTNQNNDAPTGARVSEIHIVLIGRLVLPAVDQKPVGKQNEIPVLVGLLGP